MTSTSVDELRREAQGLLQEEDGAFAMRSCWNCNGAHEHLRSTDVVICCFVCGHWFYKGVDITVEDEP